ncbi:2'-5' RNA ligase family protein [Paraburkholderia terrae]|uniref:2'-5' RNA ligase family protein n=1 Tax=Paraburkholderia terrae TaxID=311230 RepID=UPI00296AC66A|nr:2'-5' RNA ligase family protein [Paraburkholderia terrae]MDW3657081.1 2'-5' RNA ligase family protein [Paraburkholderia terrae]
MSASAFVVKVPAAESLVGDLRSRFDATAKVGVPAHITILFPFMAPDDITPVVVRQAQEALSVVPSFDFSFSGIGRFPTTTYLLASPADPFVALTTTLVKRFPAFRPYGGEHREIVPHLTVAQGDASDARVAAAEMEHRFRASPPVRTNCTTVALLEDSSGRWEDMHIFTLPRAGAL